ncbi:MAG: choice-of-anchor J domain-containing protein [Muribaculaceae bacterium]|nr:choice-of-anchor J domain-containing protein [Muribaculaceae bacterium]
MKKVLTIALSACALGGIAFLAQPLIADNASGAQPVAQDAQPVALAAAAAVAPPFQSDFSSADGLEGWTIINAEPSSKTWAYYNDYYSGETGVSIGYDSTFPKDDWLITPAITLEANQNYVFSYYVKTRSDKENWEIKYGSANTADGMTTTLGSEENYSNQEWQFKYIEFTTDNAGDFYFGIHATSPAYMYDIFVNKIRITKGTANDLPENKPAESITPPYEQGFASAAAIENWVILDANSDGKTWAVTPSGKEIRASYNYSNAMDDWLITPPFTMEYGKIYEITFKLKSEDNSNVEKIEVKYGKKLPAKLNVENISEVFINELLGETNVDSPEYKEYNLTLVPDESNDYYIGFHGISEANKYYLYLTDFKVSAGASGMAPGEVTDLLITPDPAGELKCNISFTTPTKNYLGQDLSNITAIEVLRDDELVKTFQNPEKGVKLEFEDLPSKGGFLTYSIKAKNDSGDGAIVSETVFVGKDKPVGISSAKLARVDLNGQAMVTWDPVTEDINGKTLTTNEVKYRIYNTAINSYNEPALIDILVDELTGNSYTAQLVEEGSQEFLQFAVVAYTDAGEGELAFTSMIPVGTPMEGYAESFAHCQLSTPFVYPMGGNVTMENGTWNMDPQDNDNGYLQVKLYDEGKSVELITGLISLEGFINPTLSFYTYNELQTSGPHLNTIAVSILPLNQENWIEIQEAKAVVDFFEEDNTNVWGKIMNSIPETYSNLPLQVKFTVTHYGNTKETYLDNIYFVSLPDHDLAVTSISAPVKVNTGSKYPVVVTVHNSGSNAIAASTLNLYADNEIVASEEIGELNCDEVKNITFNIEMPAIAEEPVTLYAKISTSQDDNEGNDTSEEIEVTPVVSTLPSASNLIPDVADDGVTLLWVAPDLASMVVEPYTEGFEDGVHGDAEFGEWTFVDRDGKNLYFEGFGTNVTGAFFILDHEIQESGYTKNYEAHGGKNSILSSTVSGSPFNDDWAISPELSGDAQTIKFWAKSSYTTNINYLEQMQVLYSEGSLDSDDFIAIEEAFVPDVPAEWTEYSVDLPKGAQYFAIRSFGKYNYELLIDDVYFAPVSPSSFVIEGYNIYRNGEKINETPVKDTSFADLNAPNGKHTYHVTVVYKERGESAGIATDIEYTGADGFNASQLGVYVSGRNIVVNAGGQEVIVAAMNGAVLFSGKVDSQVVVPAAKGIYVVKSGDQVKKVLVD